jgi:hypothetical protein
MPSRLKGSSAKLAPIDFSGTTTIACRSPSFASLSRVTNISARLLTDAGGDLMSRYYSPRFLQTRSCIGRMPRALARLDWLVPAYRTETDGIVGWLLMAGVRPACA